MKARRKDVLEYAEQTKDSELFRCGTCLHYQKAIICGDCYSGSRYRFDWKGYYEEHKIEIDEWIKENL